jgi:erythromycin esterase
VLLVLSAHVAAASPDADLTTWVSKSLQPIVHIQADAPTSDLRELGRMIGNSRVIAIGESAHGAAQPLEFRNRLFRYLVQEHGFTAIAIESGTVEGRVVHDYVSGGEGELHDVLARGLSWTGDDFPQNASLIAWMREYNRGHDNRLSFWGFDVPGSPGNRFAARGVQTALDEALAYVGRVDSTEAAQMRAHIERLLPLTVASYGQLPRADRDTLTATVTDLLSLVERREGDFVQATSREEYDWARNAAIGARQVDSWLRLVPDGWKPEDGFGWAEQSLRVRDRAMADNVEWILAHMARGERLLIYAAFPHLAKTEVKTSGTSVAQVGAGVYLGRRLGRDYLVIGNVVSDGQIGNCPHGRLLTLAPAPEATLSRMWSGLGVPQFVANMRTAPPKIAARLAESHDLWNGFATMSMTPSKAFDIAYFSGSLTPACVAAGGQGR